MSRHRFGWGLVLSGVLVCATGATAQGDQYTQGWCDGYAQAVQVMQQRRDAWRASLATVAPLLPRTHAQNVAWLRLDPPTSYYTGRDPVSDTIRAMADGVDLEVVLPAGRCPKAQTRR